MLCKCITGLAWWACVAAVRHLVHGATTNQPFAKGCDFDEIEWCLVKKCLSVAANRLSLLHSFPPSCPLFLPPAMGTSWRSWAKEYWECGGLQAWGPGVPSTRSSQLYTFIGPPKTRPYLLFNAGRLQSLRTAACQYSCPHRRPLSAFTSTQKTYTHTHTPLMCMSKDLIYDFQLQLMIPAAVAHVNSPNTKTLQYHLLIPLFLSLCFALLLLFPLSLFEGPKQSIAKYLNASSYIWS